MTIEYVRELLIEELMDNRNYDLQESKKKELTYILGYNDGLLTMADRIINKLREEEVIPE